MGQESPHVYPLVHDPETGEARTTLDRDFDVGTSRP